MAELIVTDASHVDQASLEDFTLDAAWGADENDFELTVDRLIDAGSYVYFDGGECGGVVDSLKDSLKDGRSTLTYGGDSAARPKPHPDLMLLALRTTGLEGADCVYVGDDLRDIEAARAAGMRSVVALWGYRLPGERPAEWGGDALAEVAADLLDPLRWP